MIKYLLMIALALCGPAAIAQADDWNEVATSDTNEYLMKYSSFQVARNKAGAEIIMIIGMARPKGGGVGRSHINKWYVLTSDCRAQYGNMTTLNVDGTFMFDAEYAFGSGTIASKIAETLCGAHSIIEKTKRAKGVGNS